MDEPQEEDTTCLLADQVTEHCANNIQVASRQFTGGPVPGQFSVGGGSQIQPPNYELRREQEVLSIRMQLEMEEVVNSSEVQPSPGVTFGLFRTLSLFILYIVLYV